MLDRHKLAQEVERLGLKLFHDTSPQILDVQKQWEVICNDPSYADFFASIKSSLLIPTWNGSLGDSLPVAPDVPSYAVLAVDGSQIYPDRHLAGVDCFLINLGGCFLSYAPTSTVHFFSEPFLFLPKQVSAEDEENLFFTSELVDLKRGELELAHAFEKAMFYRAENFLCLFDGSLIFWNLEGKQQTIIDLFLPRYLNHLLHFYEKKILNAGYISMPKSKELVNLVKISFCQKSTNTTFPCEQPTCLCSSLHDVVDTDLLDVFLKPFHRTTLFYNHAKITQSYLAKLKPCFFYLHVGHEIVRVEIPAWLAKDQAAIDLVASFCLNQSIKGYGYPVVLAEAHEQAVVKGFDREFFYQVLKKEGFAHHRSLKNSQKSIKKMSMNI